MCSLSKAAFRRRKSCHGRVAVLGQPDVRTVPVYIYGLTDTKGAVRYVGKSSDPWARLGSHMAVSASKPMRAWVKGLARRGARPGLVILFTVNPGEDAGDAELRIVREYRKRGPLLNRVFAVESARAA